MKQKLQTRFPAGFESLWMCGDYRAILLQANCRDDILIKDDFLTRIKKIIQTNEDVGKIAMAVPLLVSKALELFLQDLCNHTYDVTLSRGAKIVSSFHLKQCVHKFGIFDFLRVIVGNKVPDFGGSEGEDRCVTKRRKLINESNCNDEDMKTIQMLEVIEHTSRGRGRLRRGRRQPLKFEEEDVSPEGSWSQSPVYESLCHDNTSRKFVASHNNNHTNSGSKVKDFDLNVGLDENGDYVTWLERQLEGSSDWPLGMNEMKIDPDQPKTS